MPSRTRSAASRRRSGQPQASSARGSPRAGATVERDEGLTRLRALGFGAGDAETLWEHFDDAERRGKQGHGHARIEWLETQTGFDPAASPLRDESLGGLWRYDANGTI